MLKFSAVKKNEQEKYYEIHDNITGRSDREF